MEKNVLTDRQRLLSSMLKDARLSANLTQTTLSDRLAVPQSFVAKYELGDRRLDVFELFDILDAIGVEKSAFVGQLIQQAKRS